MLRREDMLELTRRMTPSRSSVSRIAGCYFDEAGEIDGTFNTSFLKLSVKEKEENLEIAKTVPFSETNRQLVALDFPGETRASGDMMRLLDLMMETELKNDAMLETFYEVMSEGQPKGSPYALFLFYGVYDIPRMGSDKASQWESEEIYRYLICTFSKLQGAYEPALPDSGFLYPSFYDRSADIFHIAVYEAVPGVSGEGLIRTLGCIREDGD